MIGIARHIARALDKYEWHTLVVGGWVRDLVISQIRLGSLQVDSKDIDLEIYNVKDADTLYRVLQTLGQVDVVGRSFGVFKLTIDGHTVDVSLPRRDNKEGPGHKGFTVEYDPGMTPREAAARRDFRMNSMYYDPLNGQIYDPYGGRGDLELGLLRHVNTEAFVEDPLRVLRGFQFCGRFNLTPDYVLELLCEELRDEYYFLPKERVWTEWEKWAAKSATPSMGLKFLVMTKWIEFYPDLRKLIGCPQHPEHHPEGSAWAHTLLVVDAMASICRREGIIGEDRVVLMLAALLHDIGKPLVTDWDDDKGHLTAYKHDIKGNLPARRVMKQIGAPKHIVERVIPLIVCHMRHINYHTGGQPQLPHALKLSRDLKPATVHEWILVVEADQRGRPPKGVDLSAAEKLRDLAVEAECADKPPAPILMGRHLIARGWTEGPAIGRVLDEAYELQLDGELADLDAAIQWLAKNWLQEDA